MKSRPHRRRTADAHGATDPRAARLNLVPLSALASAPLAVLTGALQARLLGPIGRGDLAAAITPGMLLAMLLCLGTPDYFSRASAQGLPPQALSYSALKLSLAVGVVALVPYVAFAWFWAAGRSGVLVFLLGFAFALPIQVYGYQLMALASGTGRWSTVSVLKVAPALITALGLAVMLLLSGMGNGSVIAVGLLLIATSAVVPIGLLASQSMRPRRADAEFVRPALSFGLRGWPAGALALLNQRVDLLLVLAMCTADVSGYYAVSVSFAAVLSAVTNSLALPVRNRIALGHVEVLKPALSSAVLIMAVSAGLSVLCSPVLIWLFLGPEFSPALPVMAVLLLGQVPQTAVVFLTQGLVSAGKPLLPLWGELSALLATVGIALVLGPVYGGVGIALAGVFGTLMSLSALWWLVRRHLGPAFRDSGWRPSVSMIRLMLGRAR